MGNMALVEGNVMSRVRGQAYVSPLQCFYFCGGLGRQHTEGCPVKHFLFFSRIMLGLKSVSFTLDCLLLRQVALWLMRKQTAHKLLV